MKNSLILSAVLLAVLVLAGCTTPSYSPPAGNQTPANNSPGANTTVPAAVVAAANNPAYGQVLTSANGMTLYVFTKDSKGVSSCNSGECLANWPPLTANSIPSVSGVPGTFSLVSRSDGRVQLAYNGMPLYRFIGDSAPGDTKGQGVNGLWFVAQANLTDFPSLVVQNQTQNTSKNQTQNQTAAQAVQALTDATYGKMLADSGGLTLYVFNQDSPQHSSCTGSCASTWPPVEASTIPSVPSASGTFALIARPDGKMQVTYNGMPLYRYAGDAKPGDASGEGILNSWYVAQANLTTFPHTTPSSVCGDGTCNGSETCSSCAADCGTCGGSYNYGY